MRRLRQIRFQAATFFLSFVSTAVSAAEPREITVQTADGARRAIVVDDAVGSAPRPVVLLFHGHGGSAEQALGTRGLAPSPLASWQDIAHREGLIVVALDGLRGADRQRGWNDCRDDAANNPPSDDVAFARAIVAKLQREAHADPARIYAMGMSNGAMMVFRLGLQMPELAAFAAVSGSMAAMSRCPEPPRAEVAALIISGDADPLVPFDGGQVGFHNTSPRGDVVAVPEAYARWAQAHGHDPSSSTQQLMPARLPGDATAAKLRYPGPTLEQSDVALVRIAGGGHVEPSIVHRYGKLYLRLVGPQSSAFESAELAWEFFKAKRRP